MRLSYAAGFICVIPICVWLILQFNADPTSVEIKYVTRVTQLTLYLLQVCVLTLILPWLAIVYDWKYCLQASGGVLVCSLPYNIFVWLATEITFSKLLFPFLLLLIFSFCLILITKSVEKVQTIAYIKQLVRVSFQTSIISVVFLYRELWMQWIA